MTEWMILMTIGCVSFVAIVAWFVWAMMKD